MRKTIAVLVALTFLLVACAKESAPAWQTGSAPQPPSSPPNVPQPAPVQEPSGSSSSIAGPSSGEGIQPTGKTKYLTMTVTSSGYDPKILTVIPGDRIKITLTNEDVKDHAFILADFSVDMAVAEGETVVVDFTPLKKGEFAWTERDGSKAGTLIVGTDQ
ncbi:cupredoxin domain-containing protein [Candidatus Woesearchaeota archaeon]|nr:cupredoxin domain-containing protein [Candidatus Woesearchaeota archaeon]